MSDKDQNSNDSKNQLDERINVDEALWDQNTYIGRWKQMAFISDFRTIFVPKEKLYQAKKLCNDYALGNEPEDLKKEDIIYAKKLYDSSFHPDNNELMNLIGRMSFQFPGNAILLMAMMTFYKSTVALLGLQVINQAFTTIVNYTNRSITTNELDETKNNIVAEEAFLCSAAASSMVVYGLKHMFYCRGPLFARLIPLGGLTIGNMINFAVIRQKEIINGIPVWIIHEEPFMNSKVAAIKAASECFFTRTLTVAPTMIMIPIVAEYIRTTCFYYRRPWALLPIKLSLCLASLLVMIPSALALYPMCNCMRPDLMKIFPSEYNEFTEKFKEEVQPDRIYYNKGL
ncbi:sideroflexin-2-like isoform X1 [Vespa crabro]|uniref:sideroflexin-2-like isoform X1 n=1 Tax=Vespa crabro TaxID=7445 RepID=UPI001EFF6FDC|nr:sideroflexin-2-like isoform X1 [Vespa crabro]